MPFFLPAFFKPTDVQKQQGRIKIGSQGRGIGLFADDVLIWIN